MKCLIGVESEEGLAASLAMLAALAPKDLETELLHVVDCAKTYPGYGLAPSAELPGALVSALDQSSKRLVAQAEEYAKSQGFSATSKLEWGSVGQDLLDEAAAYRADMIALHRRNISAIGRLFLGSVSRAVLIGSHASVLVTKGETKPTKDLSVVFGVDHSQYSNKCVELFSRLGLAGIKRLTLISAFEMEAPSDPSNVIPYRAIQDETEGLRKHIEEKNEALCARFRQLGIECESRVVEGPANQVLHDSMEDTGADLLIVGAQGHGFIERVLIGSTSLHQVAAETYPVLVLRI